MTSTSEKRAWLPDLIYTGGRFESGLALVCNEAGLIKRLAREDEVACEVIRLKDRAIIPGLVNAHSHAFQRVIRGKTEHRFHGSNDSFWTWREAMYSAAQRLEPEDIYHSARMAFLEMALSGITAVGEFHYLHRDPNGAPYDDPNLLAKLVVNAARDVGIRIALLRVAYARSGYRVESDERQKRFIEPDPDIYIRNVEQLKSDISVKLDARDAWVGIAPHSIRALPLEYLRDVIKYGDMNKLKVHMHVAEQPAENSASVAEHGRTVVNLLADEDLLSERFTCVHAVHITNDEAVKITRSKAIVCACPTTERNLGDGIVPADILTASGGRLALGSDSQTQIDLLEDARQLEYNLRLTKMERNVLEPENHLSDGHENCALARLLFDSATVNGASSIGHEGGSIDKGNPADFVTIDLDDSSIAGASEEDLLSSIVFSMARTAVRDVFVGGKRIIENGVHQTQDEIVENFVGMQERLWRQI